MKRLAIVLLFCSAALTFGGNNSRTEVEYSDAEFLPGDWTEVILFDRLNDFTFDVEQHLAGGYPGAHREITHRTAVGDGLSNGWDVVLGHYRDGATYDPGIFGPLVTLNFFLDTWVLAGGVSNAVAFGLCIRQDGIDYMGPLNSVLESGSWVQVEQLALSAFSFTDLEIGTLHPDFSGTGAAMQFGFVTENGTATVIPIYSRSLVDNWRVVASTVTSVPGCDPKLHLTRLIQNAPNPFNPATRIWYALEKPSRVTLTVYNVAGQRVRILRNGVEEGAGYHEVTWQGRNERDYPVVSGTYFYRLTASEYTETRRMVLVR